jgi:serine/threonine protein kinase
VFSVKDELILMIEYMPGGDLSKYIKAKTRMSEEDVRTVLQQVCKSIHFCHMHQIIHRDIKPYNILLEKEDSVSKIKVRRLFLIA